MASFNGAGSHFLFLISLSFLLLLQSTFSVPLSTLGFHQTNEKYLLVTIAHSGLARRLQLLSSAYQLAQDSNRGLLLAWYRNSHCDIDIRDIYEEETLALAGIVLYRGRQAPLLDLLENYQTWMNDTYTSSTQNDGLQQTIEDHEVTVFPIDRYIVSLSSLLTLEFANIVVIDSYSGMFFSHDSQDCVTYYKRTSSFFKSLTPTENVLEIKKHILGAIRPYQEQLLEEHSRVEVVGVHVRMDDINFDAPLIATSTKDYFLSWGESAPLNKYASKIVEYYDSHPNTVFYIASNQIEAKLELSRLVSEKRPEISCVYSHDSFSVSSSTNTFYDRSLQRSIFFAFAELLTLAETSFLIYPHGTSFGFLASIFETIPSVRLLDDQIIPGISFDDSVETSVETKGYCLTREFFDDYRNPQIKLHIGGQEIRPGWTIVDAVSRESITSSDAIYAQMDDLPFETNSVQEIYASHILEHASHNYDQRKQITVTETLREWRRVIKPNGILYVAVPDMMALSSLYLSSERDASERLQITRIIYGAQRDYLDFHYMGFDEELLRLLLEEQGFCDIVRISGHDGFGLFRDSSSFQIFDTPIFINTHWQNHY